jgi:hypothetical protein
VHLSHAPSAAHVERLNDRNTGERSHVGENNSTTDRSPDGHVDSGTSDPKGHDSSPSDSVGHR